MRFYARTSRRTGVSSGPLGLIVMVVVVGAFLGFVVYGLLILAVLAVVVVLADAGGRALRRRWDERQER